MVKIKNNYHIRKYKDVMKGYKSLENDKTMDKRKKWHVISNSETLSTEHSKRATRNQVEPEER